jgi:hypothetical protein
MRYITRAVTLTVAAAAVFFFHGCGMRDVAEKDYAAVARLYAPVVKNSATVPEPEFKKAVTAFKDIVEKYPGWERSASVQLMIGWMYADRGEFGKAREELEWLCMYFPRQYVLCSRAMYLKALTWEKQGNESSAVRAFRRVSELYPLTEAGLRAPFHICEYYMRLGKKKEYERAKEWAAGRYKYAMAAGPGEHIVAVAETYLNGTLALSEKFSPIAKNH